MWAYSHASLDTCQLLIFDCVLGMNDYWSQGQEVVADKALQVASEEGHWVILQVSFLFGT